jgi:acylglycerol lipase
MTRKVFPKKRIFFAFKPQRLQMLAPLVCLVLLIASAPATGSEDFAGDYLAEAQMESQTSSKLIAHTWVNDSRAIRGVVVAAHGTTQHRGSLDTLARHLSSAGFVVVSMDLRGHGLRYHKETGIQHRKIDYPRSARDLCRLSYELKEEYPGVPVFCIGESVGAAVAIQSAKSCPELFDGIILCSAGTTPCFFDPRMTVPDFLRGVVRLSKLMNVSGYITKYSSDDSRVTNEMVSDPLSRITLTPREILSTLSFLRKTPDCASKLPENVPVLFIQGGKDHIVATRTVKSMFKHLKSTDKKMVLFPSFGHVLLGTSFIKNSVLQSVENWLILHTPESANMVASLHAAPKH